MTKAKSANKPKDISKYSAFIPEDLGELCVIIAIDSSSTFTGHIGFTLNPSTGELDPIWLCEPEKCVDRHLISLGSSKKGDPITWPFVGKKLSTFEDEIAAIESQYLYTLEERGIINENTKITKFFICESVFLFQPTSIPPLYRIQTVATMHYMNRGWIVFEHQNGEAKSALGVPTNLPKNLKSAGLKSKDLVIPAVNDLFKLNIPNVFDKQGRDDYDNFSHIGDAIALGYYHGRIVWQTIQQRKLLSLTNS